MNLLEMILAVLLSWPAFYTETDEQPEARRVRLVMAALAIEHTAKQSAEPKQMAAALLTIGFEESRFAAYVGQGRCDEGPKGARCDRGKARGYWQLWRVSCPAAWELPHNTREALRAETACAARIWRGALLRNRSCHPAGKIAGAFAGYRGGADCRWPRAAGRAQRYQRVLYRLKG